MSKRVRVAVRIPLLPPLERWSGGARFLFLLVFALFISVGVRSLFGGRGVVEFWRLRTQALHLESDVAALHGELAREMAMVRALKSDHQTIERLAREQLGMAKQGEVIYLLLDGEIRPDGAPGKASSVP